uniref:Uncharacterized protein n=1 Tax=Siphoviridae sp. ctnpt50 TaxID=2827941 RepID=A0A8S5SDN3_9CAUD|nr:MAG TPA: hypothetical protein [Siphoviridae sp. ctnpt50]
MRLKGDIKAMAYVKKSIENAETTMDSVEETAEKAAKIEATSAPAIDQSSEIAALKAQIEMLTKMMAAGMGAPQTATKAPELGEDKIKIVHLYEYPEGLSTHLTYSNGYIDFYHFGQVRSLPYAVAEELIGRYRKLFDEGLLALGEGSERYADQFDVKTTKDYAFMGSDFVKRLGTMDVYELEKIYNKLCDSLRGFILEYFKRKIIEKDPAFNDAHKIEVLNRLSNGAMEDILLDRRRDASK